MLEVSALGADLQDTELYVHLSKRHPRAFAIADRAAMIFGLQNEIGRSKEPRYDHRLHGVLVVLHGRSCPEVAKLLGQAPH